MTPRWWGYNRKEVEIKSEKNTEDQEEYSEFEKLNKCISNYLNILNQDKTNACAYLNNRWSIWVCNFNYLMVHLMDLNYCRQMIGEPYSSEKADRLQDEYNKFLRRTFIIETQSIIEFIVRKYARQQDLPIKGKYSGYPDFLTVLSAVLKDKGLRGRAFSAWYKFFSFFQVIRNSVHNNYRATKTLKKKDIPEWYVAEIEIGQKIDLRSKYLMIFAQKSYDFLKAMKFP